MSNTLQDIIKDAQSVVTSWHYLDKSEFQQFSDGSLTYDEWAELFKKHGADIHKVIVAENLIIDRLAYVDAEKCIYRSILHFSPKFLNESWISELENYSQHARKCMNDLDDIKYLFEFSIPQALWILAFEQQYKTIRTDYIYPLWEHLHMHCNFAHGMWNKSVLEFVFSHTNNSNKNTLGKADSLITVYRGMGTESTPIQHTYSWTTDINKAIIFATHHRHPHCIYTAKVKVGDIVSFITDRKESEVIVRYSSLQVVRQMDMLSPTEEDFFSLLGHFGNADYEFFSGLLAEYDFPSLSSQVHGVKHALRVLLLSIIYCINNTDTEIDDCDAYSLFYFSIFHDIGRANDNEDITHGENSVELLKQHKVQFDDTGCYVDKDIVYALIKYHCCSDEEAINAITKKNWPINKTKNALQLLSIAKDMDALDRVRFHDLDYALIRNDYSKRMILIAAFLINVDVDYYYKRETTA